METKLSECIHDLVGRWPLPTTPRVRQLVILSGFILASALLYFTALGVGLIDDDFSFLNIRGLDMFFMSQSIYRPFGLVLFAASNNLAGDLAPSALHAVGIAAHALAAYLLYRLTYALTKRSILSLLAAVAWLCSPTAAEPVYWLSALVFYLPMTVVLLVAMLCAHRAFGPLCRDDPPATNSYLRLGVLLASLWALALLFHEQALVLPLLLGMLLYGGVFYPRPRIRVLPHSRLWMPMAVVAVLYGAIRVYLQAPPNLATYSVSEKAALVPYVLWRAFLPTERFIWHVVHPIETLHPLWAAALVGGVATVGLALLWARPATRPLGFGGLAIMVTALPPLVAASTGGRYLYVPAAMGMLTLALAGKVVLDQGRQHDRAVPWKAGRVGLAEVGLFALWIALVVSNVTRGREESQKWLDASRLVARMEAKVTRLVSEARDTVAPDAAGRLQIMTVDFPAERLNSAGVVRALARVQPPVGSEVVVTARLFNERNPFRQRSRWPGTYVEASDLVRAVAKSVVLVYCEAEGTVFALNAGPVPCIGASRD